jgi:hypothetical protein
MFTSVVVVIVVVVVVVGIGRDAVHYYMVAFCTELRMN